MKATFELPDDLVRAIKVRAAEEHRKLKDLVPELLRRGLTGAGDAEAPAGRRVELPLVVCGHPATKSDEITPERAAQILLEGEARAVVR